jgi:hypothetical protein
MARNLVFDLDDGRQALVTIWDNPEADPPTLALRDERGDIWGPPIDASTDEPFDEAES